MDEAIDYSPCREARRKSLLPTLHTICHRVKKSKKSKGQKRIRGALRPLLNDQTTVLQACHGVFNFTVTCHCARCRDSNHSQTNFVYRVSNVKE